MFLHYLPSVKTISFFKPLSFLGFDEELKTYCLPELMENGSWKTTTNVSRLRENASWNSVSWLSHQLTVEEYIKIGNDNNLFPTKLKIDSANKEAASKFKLQKFYLRRIKNTPDPLKYLPLILEKYPQGDFVQVYLPPMYKAFSKIPEDSLKPYFKYILDSKNIMFTKHAIILACNVFDQNTVVQTFKSFEKVESKSQKKSGFKSVLQYFRKSPRKELFDILLKWLKFLIETDAEILKKLFAVKIDKTYQEKYLQHV